MLHAKNESKVSVRQRGRAGRPAATQTTGLGRPYSWLCVNNHGVSTEVSKMGPKLIARPCPFTACWEKASSSCRCDKGVGGTRIEVKWPKAVFGLWQRGEQTLWERSRKRLPRSFCLGIHIARPAFHTACWEKASLSCRYTKRVGGAKNRGEMT